MKQLTCEMCGSTELLKEEGVFVCQTCGTKYTVEEAKKMMIDGTVDVTGSTVKIDTSNEIESLLKTAANYFDASDYESAGKYFSKALEIDSENWKAFFYSIFCSAACCKIAETQKYVNVLCKTTERVPDMINKSHNNDMEESMPDLMEYIITLNTILNWLCDGLFDFACKYEDDEYEGIFRQCSVQSETLIRMLLLKWSTFDKIKDSACFIQSAIPLLKDLEKRTKENDVQYLLKHSHFRSGTINEMVYSGTLDPSIRLNYENGRIKDCIDCIRKYEPDYISPYEEMINKAKEEYLSKEKQKQEKAKEDYEDIRESNESSSSGGCYVATAVYGSYDCTEVWTLRRYRDYTLAETWYGRAFIRAYYAISPTLVKWFGHTKWFKKMWKGKLDRMVAKLQANGVESTPYEDKEWLR